MGKSRRKARRLRKRARMVRKTSVAAIKLTQGCVREVFSHWKEKPGYFLRAFEAGLEFARKSTRDSEIRWELDKVALTAASSLYDLERERKLENARDTKNAPKKYVPPKDKPKKNEPKSGLKRSRLDRVCWNVSIYTFFGFWASATAVAYTPDRWLAIPLAILSVVAPILYCVCFPEPDEQP